MNKIKKYQNGNMSTHMPRYRRGPFSSSIFDHQANHTLQFQQFCFCVGMAMAWSTHKMRKKSAGNLYPLLTSQKTLVGGKLHCITLRPTPRGPPAPRARHTYASAGIQTPEASSAVTGCRRWWLPWNPLKRWVLWGSCWVAFCGVRGRVAWGSRQHCWKPSRRKTT